MTLMPRRPRRDLLRVNDLLERFFEEPVLRAAWDAGSLRVQDIPLDMIEEEGALIVKASVPGIEAKDLHVEVENDRLRIWGETHEDKERRDEDYYMREHRYGRLERVAALPYAVDSEQAKAEVESGVLTLTLPKAPNTQHKEVKVQVKK